LTPAERLAFVLYDMFAVPFDEIAEILERTPEAARQLASRARRRVRGAAPSADPISDKRLPVCPICRNSRSSGNKSGVFNSKPSWWEMYMNDCINHSCDSKAINPRLF